MIENLTISLYLKIKSRRDSIKSDVEYKKNKLNASSFSEKTIEKIEEKELAKHEIAS